MDCLLKCSVEASHPCDCPDLPEVCPVAVEVTDFHRQKMPVFPGVPPHSWGLLCPVRGWDPLQLAPVAS